MRFDLRPLRLTTGWSEPNAVVSRTLSVYKKVLEVEDQLLCPNVQAQTGNYYNELRNFFELC